MGGGLSQEVFLVGAVQVDVPRAAVDAVAAVESLLESVEPEDARQDVVRREDGAPPLGRQDLAGRLARDKGLAGLRLRPDPVGDAVPAQGRAVGVLPRADAPLAGRDGVEARRRRRREQGQLYLFRDSKVTRFYLVSTDPAFTVESGEVDSDS